MHPTDITKEISNLSLSEKLLLVEDIWDSIAKSNEQPTMPEWHKKELDERYKSYQRGKETLHDWKSVHHELRQKFQ